MYRFLPFTFNRLRIIKFYNGKWFRQIFNVVIGSLHPWNSGVLNIDDWVFPIVSSVIVTNINKKTADRQTYVNCPHAELNKDKRLSRCMKSHEQERRKQITMYTYDIKQDCMEILIIKTTIH